MDKSAIFSSDEKYRYRLIRRWSSAAVAGWVMLNPSTADDDADDSTIRRCMDFTRRWGHGGIIVRKLFALRVKDPQLLGRSDDLVGPYNDAYVFEADEKRHHRCRMGISRCGTW